MALLQLLCVLLLCCFSAYCNNLPKCESTSERLLCHNTDLHDVLQSENEPWNVTRLWIRSPPTMKTINATILAQLPKLKNLDIQGSKIDTLQPGLFAGTGINIVDIRLSPIQHVPLKLLENSTVEIFFFQEHKSLVIPENQPFLESGTLESLYIDNCAIRAIYPETLSLLPKLSTLSIMDNKLTSVPSSAFISNRELSNLFLERNKLTTMSVYSFSNESLHSGKLSLYLEGNPWECNINLKPLMTWPKVKLNSEATECANPSGKNWAQAVELLKDTNNK